MITIQNARLEYDGDLIFDKLNLSLTSGKISCLLGSSGVGKSSLLRLIAGLTPISKSEKETGNIISQDGKPLTKRIAYMAQQDLLLPWLSVLDNLLLGARLRGDKPQSQQALELLNKVGIVDYAHERPDKLSGGMRQRAALARTLMEDKDIVLMDEPFSALDSITRMRLQNLALQLLKNKTVLLVTHDPLEALRIADEIYVLNGKPAQLIQTATLISKAPRELNGSEVIEKYPLILEQLK